MLAAYWRGARGDLRRAWRQLQVATEPGGVATVIDGERLESGQQRLAAGHRR